MALEYVEVDKNLIVESTIGKYDVNLINIKNEPFDVYGMYDYRNQDMYLRMPRDIATEVSDGVFRLNREPTGGRIRFTTDSEYIAIKTVMGYVGYAPHYTLIEAAGFDVYFDVDGKDLLKGVFIPPHGTKEGFESVVKFRDNKPKQITICFPVHCLVKEVYIGVAPGATLGHGKKYINEKPVVCYGSSITHGTGCTRPGLTYPNILSRKYNVDILNLGFSGQCKGEMRMAEYIAGLDMSAFVYDYDHNAPTPEYLKETHEPFFKYIRERHPSLPVIMLSRPNIFPESKTNKRFRDVVYETYENAVKSGDKNVYFIDGSEYLKEFGYDNCIVDCIHPNDIGYSLMADNIGKYLEKIIAESEDFKK